jgi:hypothetical protein
MTKADADKVFEELIADFCGRIAPDFEVIRQALAADNPGWDLSTLAGDLMEYGHGKISEIEDPRDEDTKFIVAHIKHLRFDFPDAALFHAYASGCMMGLALSRQIEPQMIVPAIELAAQEATNRFIPEAERPTKRPNAFLEFTDSTTWDRLKAMPGND